MIVLVIYLGLLLIVAKGLGIPVDVRQLMSPSFTLTYSSVIETMGYLRF